MGIETERVGIRFIVGVIILAIKTGQLNLLVDILVEVVRAKLSWDVAIGRLNGEFYGQLVKGAEQKFKSENPDLFKVKSNIPGYDKWKEQNEKKK